MVLFLRGPAGLRAHCRPGQCNPHGVVPRRSTPSRPVHRRLRSVTTKAMGESFDLSLYHEATISEVRSADKHGHVIFLRLKDGRNSVLPVYIGEYECGALVKEMSKNNLAQTRPGTHDLTKNMLEALGYRVSKVRITTLVGNTYHARIHFARGRGIKSAGADVAPSATEVDIDSRPSDAINLAVRFDAPIYVNKEVAAKMAHPAAAFDERSVSAAVANGAASHPSSSSSGDIAKSCREEILHYTDPTIMYKLQLQLAIAEERFEDATRLRDVIEKTLASDRALSLVVAIETALEDQRYEEAARLRDEFRRIRLGQSSSRISDILDI